MARDTKLVEPEIVRRALVDSFVKLNPRTLMRNPVMFVVGRGLRAHDDPVLQGPELVDDRTRTCSPVSSRCSSGSPCCSPTSPRRSPKGAGKAQADTLRKTRSETVAHRRLPGGGVEDVPEHRARPRRRVRRDRGGVDPERR